MGRTLAMPPQSVLTVEKVLEEECQQVERSRTLRLGQNDYRPAAAQSLIGLAFSGGGIRSATFNLGILQALAKKQLLRGFDYVSTVSGGGYIGAWLMGWMHHQNVGIGTLEDRLSSAATPTESADPPEVHFLRDYSNYLTPRKGLLGADFWAFAAGYLRNTLLNQAILVLAFLSLLLAPRTLAHLLHLFENLEEALSGKFPDAIRAWMHSEDFALALGVVFVLVAVIFLGLNLVSVEERESSENSEAPAQKMKTDLRDRWFTSSWAVQAMIVVPLLLAASLFAYGMGQFLTDWQILDHPLYGGPVLGCVLYFALWASAFLVRGIVRTRAKTSQSGSPKVRLVLASAAVTGFLSGYLFIPFARVLAPDGSTFNIWRGMTFGTPAMVGIMLTAGVLHVGLIGRGLSDACREWWGRLGGLLMIYAASWLALCLIAIYFPSRLDQFLTSHKGITLSSVLVWVASTIYGVAFGKSSLSGLSMAAKSSQGKRLLHYLARITPYIFIAGVLLGLSLLASVLCYWLTGHETSMLFFPSDWYFSPWVPIWCVGLLAAAIVLSWRVDINEFSVHNLYRNRLIRCYLGASVPRRKAQPFIGFSDGDNFPLTDLQIPIESTNPEDGRPLPIINTSLNVVRGKELALQSRKARSFAFTPLYAGFTRQLPGGRNWQSFFGRTSEAGCHWPGYPRGVTLGTAVTISGAAASPSMGSYSEPSLAFLMTLFDVRLGWWAGNPIRKSWQRGSPVVGFWRLLCELLGSTNDDSNYLYLSDGGHFENLAIYELVRRRCKVIVACDASCDEEYKFTDLHNAMERCRTDFGVEITLPDINSLKPTDAGGESRSKAHFVRGTIRYPDGEKGTIFYVKPTLVDGDSADVLAYKKENPHFPHDTTANQWFDEAHFENYRALGQAAGEQAGEAILEEFKEIIAYDPKLKAQSPVLASSTTAASR